MIEMIVLFIRNEVVRPAIGRHDADRFLPFDPDVVLFHPILQSLGLVALAWLADGVDHRDRAVGGRDVRGRRRLGHEKNGAVRFWAGLCPPMELPLLMRVVLVPLICSWRSSAC